MTPGPLVLARIAAALFAATGCVTAASADPLVVSLDPEDGTVAEAPAAGVALPAACEPAIAAAAAAHEVPADVLLAIGMVESGLTPFVLNAEGTPKFFDDRASAAAALTELRAGGMASIDVGCMQINLRWHPDAFADPADGLDPALNADYAAKFLLGLYAMTGSWTDAVAYYHSSAQRYQRPYVCAVAARLEEMGSAMSLDCLPSETLDLPVVVDSSPAQPTVSGPIAEAGSQHMLRIAPAAGGAPQVLRGQTTTPAPADSTPALASTGPRIIRLP
ncbi:MAG: transglycosylase SLT domain-containing protein [Alphaproteobacteria bacterium]